MKVLRRLLIKFIIFVLVVAASAGAACLIHYYPQSVPLSALEQYLQFLTDNNLEKAYERLDQSENTRMTQSEYETAIQTGKYVLYDSWEIEETARRQGTNGESYVDYHVVFLNSAGTSQTETDFTVKRQSDEILGVMTQWKILSSHCMVANLQITVPAGSTLYLDQEEAGVSWLSTENENTSRDCYVIPSLLTGTVSVVVRNPILESLETTLATADGDVDYCDQMALKESAMSACKELAVTALKQIYVASVTENTEDLETVFESCMDEVIEIVESQSEEFYREDTVTHADFVSVGIYDYEAVFADPVFANGENGAITADMSFSYHYNVQNDERVETGEIWADGENAWEVRTVSHAGEAQASFVMSYYDEEWHIDSVALPVIPESE
ncbi:MAG: hypothetical protein LUF35_04885 [Lachnospiraceae bacterium]|nr:hypothetical protein [Lachnospiraceae bacterium]